jgi:YD repeat-containing protein
MRWRRDRADLLAARAAPGGLTATEYDDAQRLESITAAGVPDNTDTNGLLLNVNTNAVRQE